MIGNGAPGDLNRLRAEAQLAASERKEPTREEKVAALEADIARLESGTDPQPEHERFAALSESEQQAEVDRVRQNRWGTNAPAFTIADRHAELKRQHESSPNMRLMRLQLKKDELAKLLAEK